MNNSLFCVFLGSLLFVSCTCSKSKNNNDELDSQKRSYYLGVSLAQGIDPKGGYDEDEILRGFKNALNDSEDLPTRAQLQAFFIEEQQKKYQRENSEIFNREQSGLQFIEDLARKEQLSFAGTGVFYKITKEGVGSPPLATDKLVVKYKGILPDGSVFENTGGQPKIIPVLDTLSGWKVLASKLKKGAHIKMALSPQQAYGIKGHGKVPPMSAVVFEVEVKDVVRSNEKKVRF